jgi:hypothetical protein
MLYRMAVASATPRASFASVLELWDRSWRAALAATDRAVLLGALSSGEASARRRRIGAERELVTDELRKLERAEPLRGGDRLVPRVTRRQRSRPDRHSGGNERSRRASVASRIPVSGFADVPAARSGHG